MYNRYGICSVVFKGIINDITHWVFRGVQGVLEFHLKKIIHKYSRVYMCAITFHTITRRKFCINLYIYCQDLNENIYYKVNNLVLLKVVIFLDNNQTALVINLGRPFYRDPDRKRASGFPSQSPDGSRHSVQAKDGKSRNRNG